jgi:hypothetical protein
MNKKLELAILKEKEYYYKTFYSPRAIFLTIITLGGYQRNMVMKNMRRVGLR